MRVVPCSRDEAKRFIAHVHRHNDPPVGGVFQFGLADESGTLIAVAMVGRPVAPKAQDGRTLEVNRVCVRDLAPNANSVLYANCARVAAGLGWERLLTYTLASESGASLRACGWLREAELSHSTAGWGTNGKPLLDLFGNERMPDGPKVRWSLRLRPPCAVLKQRPKA